MSTATILEVGHNVRAFIAAVQVGESVAILDNGREVARLVPPVKARTAPAAEVKLDAWARQRLADLQATFPEPVIGATAELESFRSERI